LGEAGSEVSLPFQQRHGLGKKCIGVISGSTFAPFITAVSITIPLGKEAMQR
jgi:hypothetical protein